MKSQQLQKGIKKYRKTREILSNLDKECDSLECIDPIGDRKITCSICKVSDKFQKMSGVRIEDLDGQDLIEAKQWR